MTALYEGRHSLAMLPTGRDIHPPGRRRPEPEALHGEGGRHARQHRGEFDLEGGWKALYEKNLWILGGNPNDLLPGQRLAL